MSWTAQIITSPLPKIWAWTRSSRIEKKEKQKEEKKKQKKALLENKEEEERKKETNVHMKDEKKKRLRQDLADLQMWMKNESLMLSLSSNRDASLYTPTTNK